MAAICEGRFNPDVPRSQYWPTVMPVCRTPSPADFQGPGVVPMTPKVNIKHQILGKPAEESTAQVEPASSIKKEDDWDLIPKGPEVAEGNVIDISSSSESESSVSEMSLSSDEDARTCPEDSQMAS